jgi:hypothetical protein
MRLYSFSVTSFSTSTSSSRMSFPRRCCLGCRVSTGWRKHWCPSGFTCFLQVERLTFPQWWSLRLARVTTRWHLWHLTRDRHIDLAGRRHLYGGCSIPGFYSIDCSRYNVSIPRWGSFACGITCIGRHMGGWWSFHNLSCNYGNTAFVQERQACWL